MEFSCEATEWIDGEIGECGNPATYTLRTDQTVFHLCKEHYQELKPIFEKEND